MGLGRNYPLLPTPSKLPVYRHPGEFSPVLSKEDIRTKIDLLVKSSKIAKDSGFAGIEVHSIHWGYLLDQFALAMMNHPEDEYGGSLENRLRAAILREQVLHRPGHSVSGSNYKIRVK